MKNYTRFLRHSVVKSSRNIPVAEARNVSGNTTVKIKKLPFWSDPEMQQSLQKATMKKFHPTALMEKKLYFENIIANGNCHKTFFIGKLYTVPKVIVFSSLRNLYEYINVQTAKKYLEFFFFYSWLFCLGLHPSFQFD